MSICYLDNDVPHALTTDLQAHGHLAVHAKDIGRQRANDAQQFLHAVRSRAVLITLNGRDFLLLHQAWLLWCSEYHVAANHQGILVLRHSTMGTAAWASEINQLLAQPRPLTNRLYQWDRGAWQEL